MPNNFNKEKESWMSRWFFNNQLIMPFIIIILCLLIVYLFTKVSHLFTPVAEFIGIVGLPIVISGLLYYIFNPIVDVLEKKGIKRTLGITILYVVIAGLITWGVIVLIPKIENQTKSLIEDWPIYWTTIQNKTAEFFNAPLFDKFSDQIDKAVSEMFNSINAIFKSVSKNAFSGIGNVVGAVANIVVTVVTVPFILFYLLKDGKSLAPTVTKLLPVKIRKKTLEILTDINKQLSSYVRGQVTVAVAVAIMFIIGFSAIGLNYSITIGIFAGFMNLVPYVGSALATIPAIILALVDGPKMLIAVIIVFVLEQTIEGRFISPLVLGSQLDIHPVTIIFVLLSAGKIFGVMGVILGIPVYAAIKVVVTHLFNWYKEASGLYEEEENKEEIKG